MSEELGGQSRVRSIEGALMLAGMTALWGSTFVVVKDVVDPTGSGKGWPVGWFLCLRFALAAVCFLPFVVKQKRRVWWAGVELGVLLFAGYGTQIVGQKYTMVARSAFITSTYVIFVPLFSSLVGRRVRGLLWVCAGLAFLGIGLLSYDGSPPNVGDMWTVVTAVAYAVYIIRLEGYSRKYSATALSGISLLVVAVMAAPWAGMEQRPATPAPYFALVYLAVVCTALTTFVQTIGQSMVTASQAAVIFTLEPLFAAVCGYFWRGEVLGVRGWVGSGLIFGAALLSQMPKEKVES